MKLISLNCGLPRQVEWQGMDVTTSIFKEPVAGRVRLRTLNLDGDRQSDLSVHGGKDKAVYCYPAEHYSYWQSKLPNHSLGIGVFGENFTTVDSRELVVVETKPEDLRTDRGQDQCIWTTNRLLVELHEQLFERVWSGMSEAKLPAR